MELFGADLATSPRWRACSGHGRRRHRPRRAHHGLSDPERAAGGHAAEDAIAIADEHPGRFLVAPTVERAARLGRNCARIRELARPAVATVRVTPLVEQYELNHRLYYPVYATCEGWACRCRSTSACRVRRCARCQDPVLLEDVLIDFPASPWWAPTWATPTRRS